MLQQRLQQKQAELQQLQEQLAEVQQTAGLQQGLDPQEQELVLQQQEKAQQEQEAAAFSSLSGEPSGQCQAALATLPSDGTASANAVEEQGKTQELESLVGDTSLELEGLNLQVLSLQQLLADWEVIVSMNKELAVQYRLEKMKLLDDILAQLR